MCMFMLLLAFTSFNDFLKSSLLLYILGALLSIALVYKPTYLNNLPSAKVSLVHWLLFIFIKLKLRDYNK